MIEGDFIAIVCTREIIKLIRADSMLSAAMCTLPSADIKKLRLSIKQAINTQLSQRRLFLDSAAEQLATDE